MAEFNFDSRRDISNDPKDPKVTTWTKLRVVSNELPDPDQWTAYLQPLVHAGGHMETIWAPTKGSQDTVLLATLWWTTSECEAFEASSQLFWETLAKNGILRLDSHVMKYGFSNWFHVLPRAFVQLFWVYFPTPVTEAQRHQIIRLKGLRTPVLGFSVPVSEHSHIFRPSQMWATQPEIVNGQEAKLMLWPHFWRNEEKAEWRLIGTIMARFDASVRDAGALEWKEEFYEFRGVPRL